MLAGPAIFSAGTHAGVNHQNSCTLPILSVFSYIPGNNRCKSADQTCWLAKAM